MRVLKNVIIMTALLGIVACSNSKNSAGPEQALEQTTSEQELASGQQTSAQSAQSGKAYCKAFAVKNVKALTQFEQFADDLEDAEVSVVEYDLNAENGTTEWQITYTWEDDGLESALIYNAVISGDSDDNCAVESIGVMRAG